MKATEESRHPIQVVARRTGLSADVIRAWERRYGVVEPDRTDTRRRLYSDADAERLLLLRQATDGGRRIGDVAALDTEALRELVDADRSARSAVVDDAAEPGPRGEARVHLEACMRAVKALNAVALQAALVEAGVALSRPVLLERVLAPLMVRVGERWRNGPLRVAHEHMASASLRSFLGALLAEPGASRGPTLVVTTLPGQLHELGALMAALTGAHGGWCPLYLGPNLPVDEIAYALAQTEARAAVLSLAYPKDDAQVVASLRALRARAPEGVAVIVGGVGVGAYTEVLEEIGALRVESLDELRATLDGLRSGLPSR